MDEKNAIIKNAINIEKIIMITIKHLQSNPISALNKSSLLVCLMAYQPSWVIYCQNHSCRRTAVIPFNL